VAQYWSPGVTPSARPRPRGCALQPTATHYTPPAARQATPAHTAMARHLISRRRRWRSDTLAYETSAAPYSPRSSNSRAVGRLGELDRSEAAALPRSC
jgi:hypothetical protein